MAHNCLDCKNEIQTLQDYVFTDKEGIPHYPVCKKCFDKRCVESPPIGEIEPPLQWKIISVKLICPHCKNEDSWVLDDLIKILTYFKCSDCDSANPIPESLKEAIGKIYD